MKLKMTMSGINVDNNSTSNEVNASNNGETEIETETETETEIETETETERETETETVKSPCPYQQIIDLFHSICKSYPSVKILNEARKRALKERYEEYDKNIGAFKVLFTKAENSDFLKGQNDRSWTATFDWLINSTNMAKVLENNYKNKAKQSKEIPKKSFQNHEQREYKDLDNGQFYANNKNAEPRTNGE